MYVASKCEEYYPADLKKLVHLTENSYKEQDVFDMELVLLGVVHFQVFFNILLFVRLIFGSGVCAHPCRLSSQALPCFAQVIKGIFEDLFIFGGF